jgi:hypothetical protein
MGLPKKIMKSVRARVRARALKKSVGFVAIFLGTILSLAGAYGLAGGTVIKFTIGDKVVSAQESGIIFSVVGIIVLLGGIVIAYIGLKSSRLITISSILGLCSLIIPAMLFGINYNLPERATYNLAIGIIAIVLGYSFLATILIWLKRG